MIDDTPATSAAMLRYSVRTSPRARYARLVVSPRDGVVVVVPRRFDPRRIPALVEERAEWIRRAERRIAEERASVVDEDPDVDGVLPGRVHLRALDERWHVEYLAPGRGAPTARSATSGLVRVAGSLDDLPGVHAALGRWLAGQARAAVVPWLDELAGAHHIAVTGVSIRAQRSRWASCSNTGRISVNRSLLFLPRPLAEHLLLHELCHRTEMSHSREFWSLLRKLDPDCAEHRDGLRSGWKYVPSWAQP